MTFQIGDQVWINTSAGSPLDQVPASDCPPTWHVGLVLCNLRRQQSGPSLYRVGFPLRENALVVAGERLCSRHSNRVPAVEGVAA